MAADSSFNRKDLKAPDKFFTAFGQALEYAQNNHTRVAAVVGGVALVFVAGAVFSSWRTGLEERDAAAFVRATDAIRSESLATAAIVLDQLTVDGNRPYGELASLYAARLAYDEKRFEQAAGHYASFAGSARTPYLRQIALLGQAAAAEAADDNSQADKALEMASRIDAPYRESALRARLRVADAGEDSSVALEAIESLLEYFPGSADADELSKRQQSLAN